MSDVPVVRQPFGGPVASDGRTRSALVQLVDRIDGLAGQVASLEVASAPAKRRVGQLREHIARHVRPRALSLDAPLLVLLVGPTGAGKSSLFNALLGRPASQTGVLRPTTRELVVLARPADGDALVRFGGPLAGIDQGRLRLMRDEDAPEGLVLVDAPDVDLVEHSNRELTDRLVEAADLAVFVTTAIRYADRVPWEVLGRVRDRGLPLVVVVNRMPSDPGERQEVLEDLQRLLGDAGLVGGLGGVAVELIGVPEGSIDPETDGLQRDTVRPLLDRIDGLASSREARLELASYALAGALAGLEPHLRTVADDLEHAAIDADRLRRIATDAYERELGGLRDELSRGSFLRAEAIRQWHAFVGADEITRLLLDRHRPRASHDLDPVQGRSHRTCRRGSRADHRRPRGAGAGASRGGCAARGGGLVGGARGAGRGRARPVGLGTVARPRRATAGPPRRLGFLDRGGRTHDRWPEAAPGRGRDGRRQCGRHRGHAGDLLADRRPHRRRSGDRGRDRIPQSEAVWARCSAKRRWSR